jgi:hypothetical protein
MALPHSASISALDQLPSGSVWRLRAAVAEGHDLPDRKGCGLRART